MSILIEFLIKRLYFLNQLLKIYVLGKLSLLTIFLLTDESSFKIFDQYVVIFK